jgi:hypothetical protein
MALECEPCERLTAVAKETEVGVEKVWRVKCFMEAMLKLASLRQLPRLRIERLASLAQPESFFE